MKTTGLFTPYIPTDESKLSDQTALKEFAGVEIIFLRDPEGRDWYDIQNEFSEATVKVAFDAEGIVRSYSDDITMINPVNLAVAELSVKNIPEGFRIDEWVFDGKKLQPRIPSEEEVLSEAKANKTALLAEAGVNIAPLQDAIDLGIATDKEAEALRAWKMYRIELNRVEISKPSWPEPPYVA